MIRTSSLIGFATVLLASSIAFAQSGTREPEIGYLYPAGAQQGSIAQILVGGQNLRGVVGVHVSGEGVTASVVRYMGRWARLNGKERKELVRVMQALKKGDAAPFEALEDDPELRKIHRHPMLKELPSLSPLEIDFIERKYIKIDRRQQPNAQLAETVHIEVMVDLDAKPGNREMRLITRWGVTNPMCFQVGTVPEVNEPFPANPRGLDTEAFDVPVVLNGQITPGDTDRFCLRAAKGQKLVIRTCARILVPFLADAVPGWFQPAITLLDADGRELAYADDFRFDPDPVMYFEVPRNGIYKIEIRDAVYRGRDDFVYRVTVAEQPFITAMFPLGAEAGAKRNATIEGWNLVKAELPLDAQARGLPVRATALRQGGTFSNAVLFAVGELPETVEAEPNDETSQAQPVTLPTVVNGRIRKPGDRDRFRFEGRAGDTIVAEVTARKLRSPLDSLIRLTDASGKVLAWNDDAVDKQGHLHRGMGLLTHFADSYLCATLPEDGVYQLELTDAPGKGGESFAYRLRLSPPRPDFALRVTPSSINLQSGRATVICVHALRIDGFDGEIHVRLKDAPKGFSLQGGTLPAGRNFIRMTLTPPKKRVPGLIRLMFEGAATAGDREIVREAVPADNEMQAFLWRHLVPAKEQIATVAGRGGRALVERVGDGPVRLSPGGSVVVRMKIPPLPNPETISLELSEPPKGVSLSGLKIEKDLVEFTIEADAESAAPGLADNLIVNAFVTITPKARDGKKGKPRRVSAGILPAIPIRIVTKDDAGF